MLKWWLKPEDEERLRRRRPVRVVHWMNRQMSPYRECSTPPSVFLARRNRKWSVTVPGLKTAGAQATLPLSDEAAELVAQRFPPEPPDVAVPRVQHAPLGLLGEEEPPEALLVFRLQPAPSIAW
jgi:hypothetical protein